MPDEVVGPTPVLEISLAAPIAIDFETFFSKKLKYSVRQQIAEQYCKSHLFDPYLISASDGSSCWSGHPRDFNWSILQGRVVLAHNKYFEHTVWLEMAKRNLAPAPEFKEFHCTLNLAAYLCNRRALDDAVEHLFKTKLSKTARANSEGKHWPKDFSETEQKEMLEYSRRDAFYCWALWDRYNSQWPEFERRLSNLTIGQGMRGVQINKALLDRYLLQTHDMQIATENLIPWIRDAEDDEWEAFNAKPTSTKCIAEQCRRSGIPCPPVKSDDEEGYIEWESTYGKAHPWIKAISAWRSINKLYKTFITVKERLREDNTLPFALKYFGAHTGRWSGDAKVNMQNMRKKPVLCNEHGLLETNDKRVDLALDCKKETGAWPEWVRHSIDFRALIIPRPGKRMIASDLSQIEPRVLAWFCKDWDFLDRVRKGISVYQAHAEATMGWPSGQKMDKNSDVYKLAKARVLALGYQAGWEKFIAMAWTLARLDITKDDPEWIEKTNPLTGETEKVSGYGATSKKTVSEFRAQNTRTQALWNMLDDSFKRSVGSDFEMVLPSGRKMTYEKVRCETRIEPDPETKKPRRRSVFTADVKGGRREQIYGGKLTENLVQATARDVFAEHLLRMEDRGWVNLFSSHDEAVLEVDSDVTAEDAEREMSYCPEWLANCPIAAEAKVIEHYQK